jgi:hypothetical protein
MMKVTDTGVPEHIKGVYQELRFVNLDSTWEALDFLLGFLFKLPQPAGLLICAIKFANSLTRASGAFDSLQKFSYHDF